MNYSIHFVLLILCSMSGVYLRQAEDEDAMAPLQPLLKEETYRLDCGVPSAGLRQSLSPCRHEILPELECIAVNIKRMDVPALVELGTESVILDCDYSTGETPGPGLVIKWFFNGSTGLVYQWIPPLRPQVIGLLKGKVDMSFKISDEPLQAYRAIKIINPGTHLSGNYTCVVSTFIAEDSQTRPMLVYSPGNSFRFDQEKKYVFLVTLKCVAEYLYPRPVMTILSKGMPLERAVTDMRMDSWGMYSVETTALVHDDDVTSPWEEFVCLLSLPLANYTNNRTTIYYPGLMPTHSASIEVKKPMEHQASNSPPFARCTILLILLISIHITF